jgi:hypothetical protein
MHMYTCLNSPGSPELQFSAAGEQSYSVSARAEADVNFSCQKRFGVKMAKMLEHLSPCPSRDTPGHSVSLGRREIRTYVT